MSSSTASSLPPEPLVRRGRDGGFVAHCEDAVGFVGEREELAFALCKGLMSELLSDSRGLGDFEDEDDGRVGSSDGEM